MRFSNKTKPGELDIQPIMASFVLTVVRKRLKTVAL